MSSSIVRAWSTREQCVCQLARFAAPSPAHHCATPHLAQLLLQLLVALLRALQLQHSALLVPQRCVALLLHLRQRPPGCLQLGAPLLKHMLQLGACCPAGGHLLLVHALQRLWVQAGGGSRAHASASSDAAA
jgi:hypothetical protein